MSGGQVTPKHGSSTQNIAASHFLPGGHGNSAATHGGAPTPLSQPPPLHRSPSSILPSQSSSMPLQTSVPLPLPPTHCMEPLMHSSAPEPHAPEPPALHG